MKTSLVPNIHVTKCEVVKTSHTIIVINLIGVSKVNLDILPEIKTNLLMKKCSLKLKLLIDKLIIKC